MGGKKSVIAVGEVHGNWRVLEYVGQDPETGKRIYRCLCLICNEAVSEIRASKLKAATSGGCMSCSRTRHGLSSTHAYHIAVGIQERCLNPRSISWPHYGGRGIQLYPEWHGKDGLIRLTLWIIDNLPPWRPGLQIERIDNSKGYEPGNLTWATATEQGNNRRSNRPITYLGRTQNLKQWAKEMGIPRDTIAYRIDRLGWTVTDALTTPPALNGPQGPKPKPQQLREAA